MSAVTTIPAVVVAEPLEDPAAIVDRLTPSELSRVIDGTLRLGRSPAHDLAVWNAAMDKDRDR